MAARESNNPEALQRAEDLRRGEQSDSRSFYYGTREQLVAAGLLRNGDFPGDPECNRATCHTFERDGCRIGIQLSSRLSPRTFRLHVTDIEKARREAEHAAAEYRQRWPEVAALNRERKEAREALSKLIDSGEDFGVVRRDEEYYSEWTGTKAALIAAGVCGEQHFPTGRKRFVCWRDIDANAKGRDWTTTALRRGYFQFRIDRDEEAREQWRREVRSARPDPRTPEQVAEQYERMFMTWTDVLCDLMSGNTGFANSPRYDSATVNEVARALEHARQLLQAGIPTTPRRDQRTSGAETDATFGRFMNAALRQPARKPKR